VVESFIILFREAFEAALIVGIILSYLKRTGATSQYITVAYGTAAAIAASLVTAAAFRMLAINFEGANEEIFEGITMLVTAALLSTMIIWMIRVKPSVKQIENETSSTLTGNKWGLFFLVFVSIFREGLEAVLFLFGLDIDGANGLIGGFLGILVGVGLVYLLFRGLIRLNFKVLFNVTNTLLVLIAAGLVAHGFHELQEAGVVTFLSNVVWDINPAINADGTYPALHDHGSIGGFLSSVFGYNGNPSAIEVLSYLLYIAIIMVGAKIGKANNKVVEA
jgi:high-affinity iron transporter